MGYLPDWKAFYVGSGPDHALGYIEPPSDFKAKASGVILSISCRSPLKRIFISNAALNPLLTSSAKASKIKEWLEIDAAKPLMDELGKRSAFIEMTDSEGNFERIIPWSIAELHCTAKDSGIPITYDSMSGKFSLGL